jgi:transposase
MERVRVDASRAKAPIKGHREQYVRSLRLSISGPLVVGTPLEVDVVENYRREPVTARADGNDTGRRAGKKQRREQAGQQEVAEVVGRELELIALGDPSERTRQAKIVFDRFYVQRLASDAVDQIRRGLVRIDVDPGRKQAIKGSRFALLRSEWNLTVDDRAKISEIQRSNRSLYRAYLLKEALAHLLGYQQPRRL